MNCTCPHKGSHRGVRAETGLAIIGWRCTSCKVCGLGWPLHTKHALEVAGKPFHSYEQCDCEGDNGGNDGF